MVEKYNMSSLKAVIVKLIQNLKVKTTNIEQVMDAISKSRIKLSECILIKKFNLAVGACFEEPVKILKTNIKTFLGSQGSVLNLVDLVIPFSHDDIKVQIVKNLVKTGHKFPVKTFKALCDIEKSMDDPTTDNETEAYSEVIHACLRGLEDCMLDCKRMANIIPDSDATFFVGLYQLWKINWCSNCSSASCKHGGKILSNIALCSLLNQYFSRNGREIRHKSKSEASQSEGKKWKKWRLHHWDNLRH